MAAIDNQIISITRTAYGAYLQTCLLLGLPFSLVANTTLNERLSIEPGTKPSLGQMPTLKYLVIGNRGHKTVTADDGSEEVIPVPHDASDAGLYGLVPIVLRETTDDLPASIRTNYALRRIETHFGKTYIAYYAKRLTYSGIVPHLQEIKIVNGVAQPPVPFVPTTDNLNPTPPTIPFTGVVIGGDTSIVSSAIVEVKLTENEISEMVKAHQIRTASSRSPVISEIGFCSGVDKTINVNTGGGSFVFNEVIACQLNVIISTHHAIGYSSTGATLTFDVGNTEPLLGKTTTP